MLSQPLFVLTITSFFSISWQICSGLISGPSKTSPTPNTCRHTAQFSCCTTVAWSTVSVRDTKFFAHRTSVWPGIRMGGVGFKHRSCVSLAPFVRARLFLLDIPPHLVHPESNFPQSPACWVQTKNGALVLWHPSSGSRLPWQPSPQPEGSLRRYPSESWITFSVLRSSRLLPWGTAVPQCHVR